jgi:NAD(P)H dehydrogenase (quinone)
MIVITGASGRTGASAAKALLAAGQKIRAVGRDATKLQPFVDQGAESFLGNVEDSASMTKAFTGAEAVYLVVPEDPKQEDLPTIRKPLPMLSPRP